MHVRAASVADVRPMALLCEASDWPDGASEETMRRYLAGAQHPDGACAPRMAFLAEREGLVLGFSAGHLTTRFGCEGEVHWLLVAPLVRRHGIGRQLMVALAGWFAAMGARRVGVHVEPHHVEARRFCARLGATEHSASWMVWPDIARLPGHALADLPARP